MGRLGGLAGSLVATEFEEQATVVAWADYTRLVIDGQVDSVGAWLHAVPNGEIFNSGRFTVEQRAARWRRLVKLGVRPGIPDLYFDLPRGPYHGWRCEMKRRGERPSQEQRGRLLVLQAAGYAAHWFDSADKAIASLQAYVALGPFVAG